MNSFYRVSAAMLVCGGLPMAAMAQDAKDQPPAPPAPAAQMQAGNPNLSVATVKMDGGVRASKIIGAGVTNGANQDVGTVNDLLMDKDSRVILAVISIGGMLGVGGKLVALPIASLHIDNGGKVTLPDGSKDALGKMPGFTYSN